MARVLDLAIMARFKLGIDRFVPCPRIGERTKDTLWKQ